MQGIRYVTPEGVKTHRLRTAGYGLVCYGLATQKCLGKGRTSKKRFAIPREILGILTTVLSAQQQLLSQIQAVGCTLPTTGQEMVQSGRSLLHKHAFAP